MELSLLKNVLGRYIRVIVGPRGGGGNVDGGEGGER